MPEWGGHSALPRNSTAAPQTGWRRDGDGRHISARHTRTAPVRQGEGDAFGARSEEISRIWSRPLTFWDALLGNLTSGSQESLLFPWIPVLNPSPFCKPAFQTDALSSQSPVCLPGCSALLHHLSPAPRRAAGEAGAHHGYRDVLGAASQLLQAPEHKAATCTSQNQGERQEGRQKAPVSPREVAEVPRWTHRCFGLCMAPAKNWTQCRSP